MTLPATLVDDIESAAGLIPGAMELVGHAASNSRGFAFRCPCGCGREGYLPIRMKGSARNETPEWEWDGDRDRPSLHPSVQQVGGCEWHGWLRKGQWVPA